ncbi:MAG: ComEC/Rec2 family competence protein, partial [Terrimesophilobacter sp.]
MRVDARLALPAVAGWAVVGVVLGLPMLLPIVAITSWVIAVLAVIFALWSGRTEHRMRYPARWGAVAIVALIAAVAGVLTTSATFANASRHPAVIVEAARDHRAATVTATLQAAVSPEGTGHVPVTVTSFAVGSNELRGVEVPMLLFGSLPTAGIGSAVHATGTLVAADAGEPVAFLFFARGTPTVASESPWYLNWANTLRSTFLEASLRLGGDGGSLLPGLAIGDTSAVSTTLDAAMKATSLSHLTAVSGANCAVVVGLIMLGGGAIGLSRRWRVTCSLLLLAAFVVLVTPDASVLRAAVMASLVLAAVGSGRPVEGFPVLSLAVIVLLVVNPWLSRDYGFILSVLATGGLLLLSGPLTAALSRWMPTSVAALISVPLAAQLACQPVLILLNPAVPVFGVVANLMSEPAAPIATVIGLLACLALIVAPPVGMLLTAFAWVPSAWIAAVARFFDGLPGAQAPWL